VRFVKGDGLSRGLIPGGSFLALIFVGYYRIRQQFRRKDAISTV